MNIETSWLAATAPLAIAAGLALAAGPAAAAGRLHAGQDQEDRLHAEAADGVPLSQRRLPFFKKTAEAAGYEVIVQSAENDAQNQIAQAENVITQGVDAIVIQPVDFNVAARHRRDGDQGRHSARLL